MLNENPFSEISETENLDSLGVSNVSADPLPSISKVGHGVFTVTGYDEEQARRVCEAEPGSTMILSAPGEFLKPGSH